METSNKKKTGYSFFKINRNRDDSYYISAERPVSKEDIGTLQIGTGNNEQTISVITDPFEYRDNDQVLPIQPEQLFFMDELNRDQIKDAQALEIGLGSGVLSIFLAKNGAARITGLDINPRAKVFTGFNAMLNNVEDRIEIRDGNTDDIFGTVRDRRFDYLISNPPFEPTPPGTEYYINSASGIYGLDFMDLILKDLDGILTDNGYAQIVTMAPGDKDTPFMLTRMIDQYLPEKKITVTLDLKPIGYAEFNTRFTSLFGVDEQTINTMNAQAKQDGVTHIHMCMLHYHKGVPGSLEYTQSSKLYESWITPLGDESSNNYR